MEILGRILNVFLAIAIGSGGVIALFIGLNYTVERLPYKWRSRLLPWVFVGPALLVLGLILVIPTLITIFYSFYGPATETFVGLKNYIFAFTNQDMQVALINNVLWIVLVTGVSVSVGLILAVLMDRVSYEPIAKSVIFTPMAISFVGASVIWRFVYAYRPEGDNQIGLLNAIVTSLGFDPVGWLVERVNLLGANVLGTTALLVIMIWLQTGFCMVLLSAAVKGIPKDMIEAARIDGANEFQIFWRITIPTISSTMTVVATTVIVLVLKLFDIVWVMTNGNFGTEVVASRMIKEMFKFNNYGRGSAIATILLIAVVPIIIYNIHRFRKQEENQ
jgi:alpha-glucoside transport system permease protein